MASDGDSVLGRGMVQSDEPYVRRSGFASIISFIDASSPILVYRQPICSHGDPDAGAGIWIDTAFKAQAGMDCGAG